MGKGSDYERKLAKTLTDHDWAVMRAGSSGSATTDDRPDVLAGNGNHAWAIEAKFASERNIYVEEAEVDALVRFAERLGVQAMLLPRWNTREVEAADVADWYVVPAFRAGRTPSGKYSLNVQTVTEAFEPLDSYLVEPSDSV